MLKYLPVLLIILTSILPAQSEQDLFITEPDIIVNNEARPLPEFTPEHQKVEVPKWNEVITNVPLNIYGLASSTFTDENLLLLGILAASTTGLVVTDARTHSIVKNFCSQNRAFGNFEKSIIFLGDGKVNFGIAGLFALYGLAFKNNIALRTGMQTAEAILSTGLTVQLLKRVTGRESPLKSTSPSGVWRFFPGITKYQKNQPRYYAFPSGHLSTAVTTLTVIADNYPDSKFIRPVGYSLMGLLGVGLVSKDMHWFSDFPLAFALGYGFGKMITASNFVIREKKETSNSINISFMPVFSSGEAGINLLMSF